MSKLISQDFFNRDTILVAKELLGNNLVIDNNGVISRFKIRETEAYVGPQDKASHAHKGRTARTEVMFGPSGYFYVYLIYGMYWMLNVVTEREDHPAAILIRGVGDLDGPGKLTKALGVDGSLNGKAALPRSKVWFEMGDKDDKFDIKKAPRIGVDYAKEWAMKPYRFILID